MSRQRKKKELAGEEPISNLQRQLQGSEMSGSKSDSGLELVEELNNLLKGELQVLGSDLKDVKQDLKLYVFKNSGEIRRFGENLSTASED